MTETEQRYVVVALLNNATRILSDEERDHFQPAWLAGYVTGMIHAAEMLVELEGEEAA